MMNDKTNQSTDVVNSKAILPHSIKKFKTIKKINPNQSILNGIWIYYLLIIFEGGIRKWLAPGLATPLLIIRDPVALYILINALQKGLFPSLSPLFWMIVIGILGIFTALIFGHGNIVVAIYGARILLLHFPIIFIMGRILTIDDVIKLGRFTLLITIPMTILVALQFYSPQTAWVNRGIGGDLNGGGYNGGANGFYRPPGTFSFTTGLGQFYGLAGCYVFYFLLNPKRINRFLLFAAAVTFVAAIPLCISRSVLIQAGVSLIFAFIGALKNPKFLGTSIVAFIFILIAFVALQRTSFFSTASDAFSTRISNATGNESGSSTLNTLDRYFGGIIAALSNLSATGFWGLGLGMGSNVGSQLLAGKKTFLITEAELGRWIGELGPVMGLGVIIIRFNLAVKMLVASYKKVLIGDLLPWILISLGFIFIFEGNWSQPTSLGFCVFVGGVIVASSQMLANYKNKNHFLYKNFNDRFKSN